MSNDAYNLPGKQRLVALINEDNNTSFNMDMFRFGVPQVSFVENRNTRVLFQTRVGLFFVGNRNFFYNRLDLATFFTTAFDVEDILLPPGNYQTSMDIANKLNEIYGTAIGEDDIILEPVYGAFHVLKAVPASYAWIGQLVVQIEDVDLSQLSTLIQIQVLDGLSYPPI